MGEEKDKFSKACNRKLMTRHTKNGAKCKLNRESYYYGLKNI